MGEAVKWPQAYVCVLPILSGQCGSDCRLTSMKERQPRGHRNTHRPVVLAGNGVCGFRVQVKEVEFPSKPAVDLLAKWEALKIREASGKYALLSLVQQVTYGVITEPL